MHLSHTRQQFHEKVSGTEKILEETGDRFEAFAKKKNLWLQFHSKGECLGHQREKHLHLHKTLFLKFHDAGGGTRPSVVRAEKI